MSMTCERQAKPLKHVACGLNRHNATVRNAGRRLRCHLQPRSQMARNVANAKAEAAEKSTKVSGKTPDEDLPSVPSPIPLRLTTAHTT